MKGVVLAGGTGSRLFPLTKVTNKHLLPVGREPMIFHPIRKLLAAGMTEILVVTGVEHVGDVVNLLGSGKDFGCRFTYKVQDEAGGIAQALGLAENFAASTPVCVILGDNVFQDPIAPFAQAFARQRRGARIVLKHVKDPQRFGVAEVRGARIVGIEEKPRAPRSDLAVTGIYFYDAHVYQLIRRLRPSARGELEITDVNNAYLRAGQLRFDVIEGWWTDAGTFDSLHLANELMRPVVPLAPARARTAAPARSRARRAEG
ncbi:MAG TPA: sugar phosphate nucleotidyltransferase [Anaeromyxobacteraceae bacterium]|nr:sugar phosphate nucleotidyltransferase [Anaeromyxobacteraceae bacterium]